MSMIIHLVADPVTLRRRWPIAVDGNNDVQSGLGPDDGARLIGFGPLGTQSVTVFPEEAIDTPESVIGLVPSFSDGSGFFEWGVEIRELEVRA